MPACSSRQVPAKHVRPLSLHLVSSIGFLVFTISFLHSYLSCLLCLGFLSFWVRCVSSFLLFFRLLSFFSFTVHFLILMFSIVSPVVFLFLSFLSWPPSVVQLLQSNKGNCPSSLLHNDHCARGHEPFVAQASGLVPWDWLIQPDAAAHPWHLRTKALCASLCVHKSACVFRQKVVFPCLPFVFPYCFAKATSLHLCPF